MRLLLLGGRGDPVIVAAAKQAAVRYGGAAVRLCSFPELARAGWMHCHGTAGVASDFRLADGFSLARFRPTAVLNRVNWLPGTLHPRWPEVDRIYAATELHALLLSVLHGMGCRVVNRAGPAGLTGPQLRPLAWCARAAAAGLAVHGTGGTTRRRGAPLPPGAQLRIGLLPGLDEAACAQMGLDGPIGFAVPAAEMAGLVVVGDRVLDGPGLARNADRERACLRLARDVQADLLGVNFARAAGDPAWRFVAAEPLPGLDRNGVDALLDWLATDRS